MWVNIHNMWPLQSQFNVENLVFVVQLKIRIYNRVESNSEFLSSDTNVMVDFATSSSEPALSWF